jgi:hypothetical protein
MQTRPPADSQTQQSAQPTPRRSGRAAKLGWLALGFVLGAGFWHAVGFWSFVTAVTLTGNPPDQGGITALVLSTPKSDSVIAPPPVAATPPATRQPATHLPTHAKPSAGAPLPATAPEPVAVRPAETAATLPPPAVEPTRESRATGAPMPETQPPSTPPRTAELERRSQPEAPAARETPAWAARIITGTLDR